MVTWPHGRPHPRKRELQGVARTAVVGEAFWGLLFGTAFFAADLQALTADGRSALEGTFDGVGIGGEVLAELTSWVVAGTSALLILAEADTCDLVAKELAADSARTAGVALTPGQEQALRAVFAG